MLYFSSSWPAGLPRPAQQHTPDAPEPAPAWRRGAFTITAQTPLEDLPEYLTPEQFAAVVRIGRSTVYSLLQQGVIPHRRFGRLIRIPRDAVTTSRGKY